MKKERPKAYGEEFRREAVRLTEARPMAQVARELGIHPEPLRGWRRWARARGEGETTAPATVPPSRRKTAGCAARTSGSGRNARS